MFLLPLLNHTYPRLLNEHDCFKNLVPAATIDGKFNPRRKDEEKSSTEAMIVLEVYPAEGDRMANLTVDTPGIDEMAISKPFA